jgi:hypothetical protein
MSQTMLANELVKESFRPTCGPVANGGYKNQLNQTFVEHLNNPATTDPIFKAYQADLAEARKALRQPRLVNSWVPTVKKPVENVLRAGREIFERLRQEPTIPRQCIEAALGRNIVSTYYNCTGPKPTSVSTTSQPDCKTQEQVDYTYWLVNRTIQCLQDFEHPIPSDLVFKKISNESGFQFNACSGNGCGLGQILGLAVLTMGKPKDGFKIKRPDGSIREATQFDIANNISSDPKCAAFRGLLDNDKSDKRTRVTSYGKQNRCEILYPGSGAATNVLYSIGYWQYLKATGREMDELLHFVKTKQEDKTLSAAARASWEDARIINDAVMLGYNIGGGGAASKAVDFLKSNRVKRPDGSVDIAAYRKLMGPVGSVDYIQKVHTEVPSQINAYTRTHRLDPCPFTDGSSAGRGPAMNFQSVPKAAEPPSLRRLGTR